MHADLSKLASRPVGQDSQSPKLTDLAAEMRGPARLGCVLSGHLAKVSQPEQ
eukprot:CAMPEP_0115172338 /NCGR_PEP_ID=MMETSP0270-20121206/2762_1 /TAXON_ID=71861 /ORGANISM="Scrippsiella trochoidea, Strain CCMP3099" /LENGTH=51 /DNA_ID=CAMNT_0002585123 /DNA_START=321 /DNA_END=476 /DNA_ORIENTATION=-